MIEYKPGEDVKLLINAKILEKCPHGPLYKVTDRTKVEYWVHKNTIVGLLEE